MQSSTTVVIAPPPPVIVAAPPPMKQPRYQRAILGLAIAQLIIGCLSIILAIIIWITLTSDIMMAVSLAPQIFALGIFILVTGSVGIKSARNINNLCLVGSYMTFSILSTVGALSFGFQCASAAAVYSYCQRPDRHCNRSAAGFPIFVTVSLLMAVEVIVSLAASICWCKNGACSCCSCCGCCCPQETTGYVQLQNVAASHPVEITARPDGAGNVYPGAYPIHHHGNYHTPTANPNAVNYHPATSMPNGVSYNKPAAPGNM